MMTKKEEKEAFYKQLQSITNKIPKHHTMIFIGDFNAKVGNTNTHFERSMRTERQ